MQLVLNTYGAYLHKTGDCFEIKVGEEKRSISAQKVQSIWITTAASFSTDAIQMAMENNIDVVFLDHFGNPYARIWQSKLGSTTKIRRRQLEVSESREGLSLAMDWVVQKMSNQISFLEELQRHRAEKADTMAEYLDSMHFALQKLQAWRERQDAEPGTVRALEGGAGHAYFACLSFLIPEAWRFSGRSHQPARDGFNAMLNYSYGILYGLVERACLLAGLDPYIGFLHSDNYNKKSLIFDIIEPFRTHGDETVFYLFSKRQVKKEYFNEIPNGVTLNESGKKLLISAFNEHMDERIRYRGRNICRRDIIQFECHRLANGLLGKVVKELNSRKRSTQKHPDGVIEEE